MKTARESLRALLLWDRPTLQASDLAGADELVSVFDLRLRRQKAPRPHDDSSPFFSIVDGLSAELRGEPESALASYELIAEDPDPLVRLTGLLLLAWMESAKEQRFQQVVDYVKTINIDAILSTSIDCKLTTWALDRGWRTLAVERLSSAVRSAEGDTLRSLRQVEAWILGRTFWSDTKAPIRDPLVLYPWINSSVAGAAELSIEKFVSESSQRSIRQVFAGSNHSAERSLLESAELQASWAGALWLLPEIRRQHAAHVLGDSQSSDLDRGLANWVLGGGKNITAVISDREGSFADDTAEKIIGYHLKLGERPFRSSAFVSACLALWDEISEKTCQQILPTLNIPTDPLTATHDDSAKLFGALLARIPREWLKRYRDLTADQQVSIALNIEPSVAITLDPAVRLGLAGLLQDVLLENDDVAVNADQAWLTVASIHEVDKTFIPSGELWARMPNGLIPIIARRWEDLLPDQLITLSREQLRAAIESDLEAAKNHSYSGYFHDPYVRYAQSLTGVPSVSDADLSPLIETVNSPHSSAEQKFGALRGIDYLASISDISAGQLESIVLNSEESRSLWTRGGTSPDHLRVAYLALQVYGAKTDVLDGALLAATRSPDERIRAIALDSALDVSSRRKSAAIDTALFGALFDPSDRIQRLGLEALRQNRLHNPALVQAAGERILQMWPTSHRSVREFITRAMKTRVDGSNLEGVSEQILAMAKLDRSWLVRNSAIRE